MDKIKIIETEFTKRQVPKFNVGDTVRVLTKIAEGPDKVRLHPFEGIVIAKRDSGIRSSFIVRKVSYGEGIERVFPLFSPNIERIELVRSGKVKRSKLYYLRKKVGRHASRIDLQEEDGARQG